MIENCHIVGPYLPVGDIDWMCDNHKVPAVLAHKERFGAKDLRREDFVCPVDPPHGWYQFGTHVNGLPDGIYLVFSDAIGRDGLPVWETFVVDETVVRRKVADEIETERRALPDPVPGHLGATRSGDDCSWAMAHARDVAVHGLGYFAFAYGGRAAE